MSFSDLPLDAKTHDTDDVMVLPHLNVRLLLRLLVVTAILLVAAAGISSASEMGAGKLTCEPCHFRFGKIGTGQSKTLSATLTNVGGKSLTVSQMNDNAPSYNITNLSFPLTLASGQSKTFDITFMPTDNGRILGNLQFISNAPGSGVTLYLYGVGAMDETLTANPWGIDFGNVEAGQSDTRTQSLTNSGTSSVTISRCTVEGAGFGMSDLRLPLTLSAGESYTFNVRFTPTADGDADGTMSVVSNAPNPTLIVPLSGTGTAAGVLTNTPSHMDFGNVTVDASKEMAGKLSASGASVTVTAALTTSSEFTVSGLSFPVTIAPSKSASFTVTFKPGSSGAASSKISFVSNASDTPTIESVKGRGTPAPQHSVQLSWDSSGDINVVGYNIYRGKKFGGPFSKINSRLDPLTGYTDTTVEGGQTYYFAATAVDADGTESKPSNIAKAVIPFP